MNQRYLIIAPRFPVTDDRIIATWALNQAKALRRNGGAVEVISPSPYVPKSVGEFFGYTRWSNLDRQKNFDGIDAFYPRVPVYNVNRLDYIYNRIPQLEVGLMWHFSKQTIQSRIRSFKPDSLLCHHPLPGGYIGMKVESSYDIPYAAVEHSLTDIKRTAINHRRRNLYREITTNSESTITVSEMMKDRIHNLISSKIEVDVVYNGYDPTEIKLDRASIRKDRQDNIIHILSIGSFIERKGQQYLIKALSRMRDQVKTEVQCTLVGDGPLEVELKKLTRIHNLEEAVQFRSGLSRTELNRLMASADLFALPSWDEPCAVVYPEVMAHGVPTIMCEGQGFSELIEDGKTGFLVPPQDVPELAKTLCKAVSDLDRTQKVGLRGQRLVQSKLTWDDNANKIRKVIDRHL